MNPEKATQIAMDARPEFGVGQEFRPSAAERRVIELVEGHTAVDRLPEAGPTRDIQAWIVTLSTAHRSAEFAVDDGGRIVRVRLSR